jgi:hypothetical protein
MIEFVRRFAEKDGVQRSGPDWVKAHAIGGVTTNAVTAAVLQGRGAGDSPPFQPPVAATAAAGLTVKEVPADKAYLSHDNLELVGRLGGTACVPFQVNSAPGGLADGPAAGVTSSLPKRGVFCQDGVRCQSPFGVCHLLAQTLC